MKIAEFEVVGVGNPWKNWLLVALTTDSGLVGYGEGTLNGFEQAVRTLLETLSGSFLGRDPHEIKSIRNDMLTQRYSDGGQIQRAAIAAIEVACWDILGKEMGQPVHNLWGGAVRDSIRLYANGWYQTERDPELVVAKAKEAVELGYTALKIDPFGAARRGLAREDHDVAIDILTGIKRALPNTDLLVEGHCRFDVPTALGLAKTLGDIGVGWFEEPVSYENLRGLAEVADRSPVPIATGENFTSVSQFIELTKRSHNFVLQPDVLNLGGLLAARQVCELGETLDLPVAPHDAQGPISKACCLQLAAHSPAIMIQEDFEEFNEPWTRELSSPLDKSDGVVRIPIEPGIGRSIDFANAKEHPANAEGFLALYQPGWEMRKSHEGLS